MGMCWRGLFRWKRFDRMGATHMRKAVAKVRGRGLRMQRFAVTWSHTNSSVQQ